MNPAMKTQGKEVGFALFLLVGALVAVVLWACSTTSQPSGPSRIAWPASK